LEAFREQMTRAEHLASLGTLGATLAHELTQPLTVIQLSIQNALKGLEGTSSPKAVREDLHDSLEEISNATAIIERFRSFVRQPSKEAVTNVAVHKVAQRILRLLEESTRRLGVTLESRDLGDLPPVRVRESELAQVFFVLSQNAIQAADPAKGSCLCVSGRRQGDSVELQFKDNCAGISADHLEHIFEPFFTTKPPGEGTGLGLCVVQRIVSQAGGHLRVESKLGRGTTFFVTLPIKGT